MKISVACCTYLRPKSLGQVIACFEAQDYPAELRELVILDDAGQYKNQQGDRWRLISMPSRFKTLGEKRNASIGLVSPDTEAVAIWDDDDIYLPWALSATVSALKNAPWSLPGLVLRRSPMRKYDRRQTNGLYHGGWGYRLDMFHEVGGYPAMDKGEDQTFARRLRNAGYQSADPCQLGFEPFYIYRWQGGRRNLSGMGPNGYQWLGNRPVQRSKLVIRLPNDYHNIANHH